MTKLRLLSFYKPRLIFKNQIFKCQLGRGGRSYPFQRKEGDFTTPIGKWKLGKIFIRRDKIPFLKVSKKLRKKITYISNDIGWCDDIISQHYNKQINIQKIPNARHESLLRNDNVYDIIIEIEYNQKPIIRGKGSAIFIHCSFFDARPTQGCLAMQKKDLIFILKNLKNYSFVVIS